MQTHELKSTVLNADVYKVSAYTALTMIIFFAIMNVAGLVAFIELRFMNFLFLLVGIRTVLLRYRKSNDGKLEYLRGIFTGFMTAVFTTFIFAVFICIYLVVDNNFMHYLQATQPFGNYLTPATAALVIAMEGIASGAILSFALMHLLNIDEDHG